MSDLVKLRPILNNSKLQTENPALWQVINELLSEVIRLSSISQALISSGVWTAADNSGAGLVITTNISSWLKIDRLLVASINLSYPVTASGAAATIKGLPLPAMLELASSHSCAIGYANKTLPGLSAYVVTGTNSINFALDTGALATNAQLSAGNLALTAIYFTP